MLPKQYICDCHPTQELEQALDYYTEIPLIISKPQANAFEQIISYISSVSVIDETLLIYLTILYGNDFVALHNNNSNLSFVRQITYFALDFTTALLSNIEKVIKINLGCQDCYNKVVSQKYFIKGLINELNLYKEFGHFYLPKYVQNTGRVFTETYFLTL